METKEIVRQIELRLVELGMKKGDFYKKSSVEKMVRYSCFFLRLML